MVKVLIVDDSALVRQLLSHMLSQAQDIDVVGCAEDPYEAREMIKALQPDVLTLDVEMPKMDGLAFLRNLMRLRPMPVVMVSSLTERGADVTLEALSLGAVDFIAKPKQDLTNRLLDYQQELIDKVHLAAASHVIPQQSSTAPLNGDAKLKNRIIAIGASTGGTEAIQRVVAPLPANTPHSHSPAYSRGLQRFICPPPQPTRQNGSDRGSGRGKIESGRCLSGTGPCPLGTRAPWRSYLHQAAGYRNRQPP